MAHYRTMMQRGTRRPSTAVAVRAPANRGAWLTIQEYAPLRGKSVETIRRAIRDRGIEAKKIQGPHGPQWLVWAEDAPSTQSPALKPTAGFGAHRPSACSRCGTPKMSGSHCRPCRRRKLLRLPERAQ